MKFPSWRNVVCAHMMEDMLFKKEQGPHDPVCDLATEYRAMMQGVQEACIRRRRQKEEPSRSNINNKQQFEHAPKIQAPKHTMEEGHEHERQQTCLMEHNRIYYKKAGIVKEDKDGR